MASVGVSLPQSWTETGELVQIHAHTRTHTYYSSEVISCLFFEFQFRILPEGEIRSLHHECVRSLCLP